MPVTVIPHQSSPHDLDGLAETRYPEVTISFSALHSEHSSRQSANQSIVAPPIPSHLTKIDSNVYQTPVTRFK